MAHTCPECGLLCHCSGDIDDICFGEDPLCTHCDEDWEDDENYGDEDESLSDPTAHDPLAKAGIVEYPKNREEE